MGPSLWSLSHKHHQWRNLIQIPDSRVIKKKHTQQKPQECYQWQEGKIILESKAAVGTGQIPVFRNILTIKHKCMPGK